MARKEQKLTESYLENIREDKGALLQEFLDGQPPEYNGERLLDLWDQIYDENIQKTVIKTVNGPSDNSEPATWVFPYEKLAAVLGDTGSWKWPRMWQRFDEIERRGERYREGDHVNFGMPNKNDKIVPQTVLIVGGGPVGLRMAIELQMGGHHVIQVEKRREVKEGDDLMALGFTNRINRPHMWPFVRNDLLKLNGRDFMSTKAAYPVFTEPETSSIGIDELQCLLLKNALLLGVDFRLGVGFENAKILIDETSFMPSWQCDLKYDKIAQEKYGMSREKNVQVFTCLIGCDGPRSTVRTTQSKYFGNIEKRKFMDAVGIVANVSKCSRKKLKELGFEFSQEPPDMNKGKMVFKDFFKQLSQPVPEGGPVKGGGADADIQSLIYYKAAHHNYVILVPERSDLVKHGLSGKVYSFHDARGRAAGNCQTEEKEKLKDYCTTVLKAAGIPIDSKGPNKGFVKEPNDCMAFDFAECWNTKKSLHFSYPDFGWDVEDDGEWEGKKVVPFIALAGDSLLEPFWPMGLGLKRGWQAVMDVNYCIDNLFNMEEVAEKKGCDPDMEWQEHFENLRELASDNFEYCNRLLVAEEMALGEYTDKGQVMTQLRRFNSDATKPLWEVEIDPATRYAPLAFKNETRWKNMTQQEKRENVHPKVLRVRALQAYYHDREKAGKDGNFLYEGKELISINGRVKSSYGQQGRRPSMSEKKKEKKKPQFGKKAAGAAKPAEASGKDEQAEVKEVVEARKSINALTASMSKLAAGEIPTSSEAGLAELRKMRESLRGAMDQVLQAESSVAKEIAK